MLGKLYEKPLISLSLMRRFAEKQFCAFCIQLGLFAPGAINVFLGPQLQVDFILVGF